MSEQRSSSAFIKRSLWLGLCVGWLTQLGLKTIFPMAVLAAVRYFSLETENKSLWLEEPGNSSHPVWYALQASVFVGSLLAGWLAARLSPRKSLVVPITLVILSLLATGFEQFPSPISTPVVLVWAAGPCVGLVLGWLLAQLLARSDT
jgi:MFS-type transporter involved in bile tolerance (Atg22 family)